MNKRRNSNHSEQPTFSMKVWSDLSFALQIWARICQDTDRIASFDSMKAEGTEDGPWHTDGNFNYRRLTRLIVLDSAALGTVLNIELVGFEIHEAGAHKPHFKWHFVSARLIGNGEVEVWNSTQLAWMRNTPHARVLPADHVIYYVREEYFNAHAL